MGDRTWAEIRFRVPDPVPEELQLVAEDQGFQEFEGAEGEPYRNFRLTPGARFRGACEEVNYGNFYGLEEALLKLKIPYVKQWAPGGTYPAGEEYFDGEASMDSATIEGEVVAYESEIRKRIGKWRSGEWTAEAALESIERECLHELIPWDQFRTEAEQEHLKTSDGPPYDAATATGMYDHD